MSIISRIVGAAAGFVAVVALLALAVTPASAQLHELDGAIHVHSGTPASFGNEPGGSWVRILEPDEEGNADPENDVFLVNPSSANVADPTYTLLQAGAGELQLGAYQGFPASAGEIVTPVRWGAPAPGPGADFDIFTYEEDPAGAKPGHHPPPHLEYDEEQDHVVGDLGSWTVNFGGAWYSQGADSAEPSDIHHPDHNLEGHYDEEEDHIELRWTSVIVDHYAEPPATTGAFHNHIGHWRIEGTLEPPEEQA